MGKILSSFFFPHVCVYHKVCVRFEQIVETPVGACRIPIYGRQDEMFKKR
jgi:hypothetical protein